MWFIGVEVEEETSAPPPNKNPGSAPVTLMKNVRETSVIESRRHRNCYKQCNREFPVCGIFS